jgi:hypothetical protein
MKHFKTFAAFACGCAAATVLAAPHVAARRGDDAVVHVCAAQDGVLRLAPPSAACPAGQKSLLLKRAEADAEAPRPENENKAEAGQSAATQRRIGELERQVKALEELAAHNELGSKVVAPFTVTDRAGRSIFSVEEGLVAVYNTTGKMIAGIRAKESGGGFYAYSAVTDLETSLGAGAKSVGVYVIEGQTHRIDLGRNPDTGMYRMLFFSGGGATVAGVGQSQTGAGLAFTADTKGTYKSRMYVASDGKGLFRISRTGEDTLAQLTEGANGGLLTLYSSQGEPMVDAGVEAGGFGVVRAGPAAFRSGVGLLGLPGSYIAGKPNK